MARASLRLSVTFANKNTTSKHLITSVTFHAQIGFTKMQALKLVKAVPTTATLAQMGQLA